MSMLVKGCQPLGDSFSGRQCFGTSVQNLQWDSSGRLKEHLGQSAALPLLDILCRAESARIRAVLTMYGGV